MIRNFNKLPEFLNGSKVVGTFSDDIKKYSFLSEKRDLLNTLSEKEKLFEIKNEGVPLTFFSKEIASVYQKADFNKVKELEKKNQKDLKPVYDNIIENSENAWTPLEVIETGKKYYAVFSQKGIIWTAVNYIEKKLTKDGEVKFEAVVSCGTYSDSTQILGLYQYNMTFGVQLTEGILSIILSQAITQLIKSGSSFFLFNISKALSNFFLEKLKIPMTVQFATRSISFITSSFISFLCFIAIAYLWNWANRVYSYRLQIFNWSYDYDWSIVDKKLLNAKISNNEEDSFLCSIPKMLEKGEEILPPGMPPSKNLEDICHFAIFVIENDNTFFEGCSLVLKFEQGNSKEGFMYALDGPRFGKNNQAVEDGLKDAQTYYNNAKWSKTPKNIKISTTSNEIPVSVFLDKTSGDEDNIYNVIININKS